MRRKWCERIIRSSLSFGVIASTSSAAIAQSIAVPGTIQAEDFSQGTAGVAYSDTTPGNAGGLYRSADVDIETTTDNGGGYNVGWVRAGEWLNYNVTVATGTSYTLEFRVACQGPGGVFHVEANGVDVTGPLNIPDTGGWQSWVTVTKTGVNLSAGQQELTLVFDAAGGSGNIGNINYIRVLAPAGGSSTPYSGTPSPLPGRLEAENFDNGGEGVAYHDLTVGNSGGQYRSTGVDIEALADDSGYALAYVKAGEWLNYTVNVTAAGTYDVEVRVARAGSGGTFHIEVNGVDRTGPFTIPDTGDWQTWMTIRKTGLSLSAGPQVLRIVMDSNGPTGSVGNIDSVRFVAGAAPGPTPFTGTPVPLPGLLQSEDFDNGGEGIAYHDLTASNDGGEYRSERVDIERTTDGGGGFNVGWIRAGEWLAYTVDVGTAGTYDIEVRVASSGGGGTFHIEVDGVDRTGIFTVPVTGDAQSWVTIRKTGLSLSAGRQLWRVVMDTNGPGGGVGNLNYIRLVTPSAPGNQPPTVGITSPSNGATFTAPATITINATASDSNGTITKVEFYRGSTLVGSDTSSPYSYTWSNAAAGSYALTAVAFDNGGASTTSAAVNVTVSTQSGGVPAPWTSGDVGGPALAGSSSFANDTFTVTGAGVDVWDVSDQFHFLRQPISGDVEVIARVNSLQGTNSWAKGGVMIRENLTAGSPNAYATATVGEGWTFQRRRVAGGQSYGIQRPAGTAPGWVRLVRIGTQVTGSYSLDGSTWTQLGTDTITMASTVYVGFAVTNHDAAGRATATFSNVAVRPLTGTNTPPTVAITSPSNGATFTAPATITINANASDSNGTITRVEFYRGSTLVGSDTSAPYSYTWSGAAAGSYALTAVAFDNGGASTTSTAVNVTVTTGSQPPTSVAFTASPDHATGVTSYSVALRRAGDPVSATPVATKNLGKPTPVSNEITADISDIVNPLAAGSYYAVVTAIGPVGSTASTPSPAFTR